MKNHTISLCCFAALTFGLSAAFAVDVDGLLARIPDRDPDGKHSGPLPADATALIDGIVGGGQESVAALIGRLVEPGEKEDYKSRYALHALALHATAPGRDAVKGQLVAGLIAGLKARPGPDICKFLIEELQFLHAQEAIDGLADCLADDDLYAQAVVALVATGGKSGDVLLAALQKATGRKELALIQALGDLRVAAAVPVLLSRLTGTPPEVSTAAGVALARIGHAGAAAPMLTCLGRLEGCGRDEMTDACFVLAKHLIADNQRESAFGIYRGVWQAMGDSSAPHVRSAIMDGLAAGLSSESSDSLTAKLKGDESVTRAAALHVLGARRDPATFKAMAAAMKDADPGVRLVAARTLPLVGAEQSVPYLVSALPGDDPETAHVLRSSLITLTGDGADKALADALTGVPDADNAAAVRQTLLQILANRKSPIAGDAVFALIGNSDDGVRAIALKTLGELGEGRFAAPLAAHVRGGKARGELKVAEDALAAVCARVSGGMQQVNVLKEAMQGADPDTASLFLRVMGRLGSGDAQACLLQAVSTTEGVVQDQAVRSLADFPNERPAPELLKLARSATGEKQRVLALRGYVRMAEKNGQDHERLVMLREAVNAAVRPDEKKLALGVMGKTHTVEALKQVSAYMDDADVANEAALAAIQIGERIRLNHADDVRAVMERIVAVTKDTGTRNRANGLLKKLGKQ